MAQLHSIHLGLNAIERVRARLYTGQSAKQCVDCSTTIPVARREAVKGCIRCIVCQTAYEHQ